MWPPQPEQTPATPSLHSQPFTFLRRGVGEGKLPKMELEAPKMELEAAPKMELTGSTFIPDTGENF